jgi:hypothetical protein
MEAISRPAEARKRISACASFSGGSESLSRSGCVADRWLQACPPVAGRLAAAICRLVCAESLFKLRQSEAQHTRMMRAGSARHGGHCRAASIRVRGQADHNAGTTTGTRTSSSSWTESPDDSESRRVTVGAGPTVRPGDRPSRRSRWPSSGHRISDGWNIGDQLRSAMEHRRSAAAVTATVSHRA